MKTGLQITIDRYAGWFACRILRLLVIIAGKILRINHRLDKPFKRIVVCKFKGMGSIIQASALLKSLRMMYPEAEIVFLSTSANLAVAEGYKTFINRSLLINDKGIFTLIKSTFSALLKLWRFKPEVYIDLEVYSNFSSLICTLSLAKNRIGFYKSDKDYRSGLYTHLIYYNIKAPLSEIYLQTARLLGSAGIYTKLTPPDLPVTRIEEICLALGLHGLYMIINPNASDLRLERRWTKQAFQEFIRSFKQRYPELTIVLIGSAAERDYVNTVYAPFSEDASVINVAGKTSVADLLTLIKDAACILTNDTGPLHLALALEQPVVGLFGPCSPDQYGQMERCIPIYKNVYCSPCVHEFSIPPCKGNNTCMQLIEVNEVLNACQKALDENFPRRTNPIFYTQTTDEKEIPLGSVNNRL
ncbi:MAG: glycosyltransferase family 9 protein [Bacteroidia bacterium]